MAAVATIHPFIFDGSVTGLQAPKAAHLAGRERLGPPDAPPPLFQEFIRDRHGTPEPHRPKPIWGGFNLPQSQVLDAASGDTRDALRQLLLRDRVIHPLKPQFRTLQGTGDPKSAYLSDGLSHFDGQIVCQSVVLPSWDL